MNTNPIPNLNTLILRPEVVTSHPIYPYVLTNQARSSARRASTSRAAASSDEGGSLLPRLTLPLS